jgi:S-adenosyl-L-methionine hydrolase (adenosine-forming)
MPHRPVITFLSDYGLADEFVGVCHGVIARICPQARVIDLTHGVPRHDIRAGAVILEQALGYMPAGVHLAVVDPGVGGPRRAVALELADRRLLVGPDNGLLAPAADAGGGVVNAVEIGGSRFALQPTSATFHGRDVFAPVAAALAAGAELAESGDEIDPLSLSTLPLAPPRRAGGALIVTVLHVDGFGNATLGATIDDLDGLGESLTLTPAGGGSQPATRGRTFADVGPGELIVYEDSTRRLAVAVAHGDAGARLGLAAGGELRIATR